MMASRSVRTRDRCPAEDVGNGMVEGDPDGTVETLATAGVLRRGPNARLGLSRQPAPGRKCRLMATIVPERLLGDLRRLRSFGATGSGVVRLALSPVDMEARHWLCGRMGEAGLDAAIDGGGAVFGRSRKPGPRSSSAPTAIRSRAAAGSMEPWA